MAKHIVEELVSKIRMDAEDYLSNSEKVNKASDKSASSMEEAEKRGTKANDGLTESNRKAGDAAKESSEKQSKASEQASEKSQELAANIGVVVKGLIALYAQIKSSQIIMQLARQSAQLNNQLEFMSQRLNTVTSEIRKMSTAADALGGSGEGMVNTMRDMNQSIQEMVLMGDTSLMPFMSALGVGMVDSAGNAREAKDVILDIADALQQIDPRKAYAIASSMGFDDDTINAMMQGRDAMQEMMNMQGDVYVSTEAQLQASRDLIRAQSLMEARWLSLKTVIGNAVTPALTAVYEIAEDFINFFVKNEHLVTGMLISIGTIITGFLIPKIGALIAALAPIAAPVAVVTSLGLAFAALYDDYKVWAEGGESLFDWTVFNKYITESEISVDNLSAAFRGLIGDYESWGEAYNAFQDWLNMSGIIKDGEFSIRGLASSFVDLASDLIKSTGLLEDFALILAHISDGEYMKAARVAGGIGIKAAEGLYDAGGAVVEGGASFVDRAFGHDPESEDSLAGIARSVHEDEDVRGIFDSASKFVVGDATERTTDRESANNSLFNSLSRGVKHINDVGARARGDYGSDAVNRVLEKSQLTTSNIESTVNSIMMGNAGTYANTSYLTRDSQSNFDQSKNSRSVEVIIDKINVNTSANTVTGAAADGVEKAISQRVSRLDLMGSGL